MWDGAWRKRTRTIAALSVIATALLAVGCGQTRKVPKAGAPAVGGEAMGGNGNAEGGDAHGTGADSPGIGGNAGAEGGTDPVTTFGGAPTWDPLACHAATAPEPADPTAREQWALARDFCLALAPECLQSGSVLAAQGCSVDQVVEQCVSEVLWFRYQTLSADCEDAWRKDLECGSQSTFSGSACFAVATSGPYGSAEACAEENAALRDCQEMHSADVEVDGSYTTCWYSAAPASAATCDVTCQLGDNWASLRCSGPAGLPKQCGCTINGHVLTRPEPIFVSDCADAAAQAADGLCTGQLDCCFEYSDLGKPACRCEHPADFGYDSCEAMMAVANARRVGICPGLLPNDGGSGCWPPDNCMP